MALSLDGPNRFMKKHLEKILFVISLAFYASEFFDDRFQHWGFIGGYSTLIALILTGRKRKGLPLFDLSVQVMVACVIFLLGMRILDYIRG
ncbi:MAG TPA: hypothetical protein VE954_19440 [Oligoflexus sp.]|nr:hypothetical protein [Oligoflexus sp.]